jgi:phosphohistidine phosphatase
MLYLVRHGKAEEGPVDAERRLTDKGEKAIQQVAERLAAAGVRLDRVEHSGLARARETAELLQDHLGGELAAVRDLGPMDDVEPVADRLDEAGQDEVMLVGHLPFMERLAAYLLTGDADAELLHFRTSAVACFAQSDGGSLKPAGRSLRPAGRWVLEWFLSPGVV